MAHWNEVAVTAVGEEMLNDLLSGRRLTVLSAYGGTGETAPEDLAALTDVAGERHRLEILDVENGLEGKTVKVQVSNEGVTEGYILHQIGVFASVDDGEEQLLCVYQDRDQENRRGGMEVPAQADCPTFLLEFYGFIKITNGVKFEVDLSQSGAIVTPQYLADVMAAHNQDSTAHQDLREAIRQIEETAKEAAEVRPETGTEPPTPETEGKVGQRYFDTIHLREYICIGQDEESRYIWVPAGANRAEDVEVDGRTLAEVLAELGDRSTHNGVQTPILTIPVSAWQADEDGPGSYRAEIACEEATDAHIPYVSLDKPSMQTATNCGFCDKAEASEGVMRFWADTVPETDIIARAALFGPGSSGGGGFTLPTATADRLGGIKIKPGSGLTVDAEGNIALDAASNEEVAALFNGSKAD